jgi:hypothetical protein
LLLALFSAILTPAYRFPRRSFLLISVSVSVKTSVRLSFLHEKNIQKVQKGSKNFFTKVSAGY